MARVSSSTATVELPAKPVDAEEAKVDVTVMLKLMLTRSEKEVSEPVS